MNVGREKGIALIIVLWTVVLLTVLSGPLLKETRLFTQSATLQTQHLKLKSIIAGEVHRAISKMIGITELTDPENAEANYVTSLEVAIEDEASKVDLNVASADTLRGLLETITDEDTARVISQQILDWRDPDLDRRKDGAEVDDYREMGQNYGPRNDKFESISEIYQVLEVDRSLAESMLPHITVYSKNRHGWQLPPPGSEMNSAGDTTRFKVGQVYTIAISGQLKTVSAGAVVRVLLTADSDDPFRILNWEWRRGES